MKTYYLNFFIFFIIISVLGCIKDDNNVPPLTNSDIDKSLSFNVILEKDIEYSSYNAIFFERYFILPHNLNEFDVYSKETCELIVKIGKDKISNYNLDDLIIQDDNLYAFSYENQHMYKFNLISKEIFQTDSLPFIYDFTIDKDDIYYSTNKGVFKTDFNQTFIDSLYDYKITDYKTNVNHIELKIYKSLQQNKKYLIFSFIKKINFNINKFNVIVLDLYEKNIISDKSFDMIDNLYNLKIENGNLCISSMPMIYVYNLNDDNKHYLVNSPNTYNFSRDVNVTNDNILYFNTVNYNCYNYRNGNLEWTINNRYIEDVSSIKLNNFEYLNLLKENTLNLIDIKTGKTRAIFEYKIDGKIKYFRECSDVFNGNEIILRQGNNKLLKVIISKY